MEKPTAVILTQQRYASGWLADFALARRLSAGLHHKITDRVHLTAIPHLGAGLLAAQLEAQGYHPAIADLYSPHAVRLLADADAGLVSVMDVGIDRTIELLSQVDDRTRARILLGGYGAVAAANEVHNRYPNTTIVHGEAEGVLEQAISDLHSQGQMASDYRRTGPYQLAEFRDHPFMVPDINVLARRLMSGHELIKPVEFSRGCGEGCDFCVSARQSGIYKSAETVKTELDMVKFGPFDQLFIVDQNLMVLPRDNLLAIMDYLNKRRIRWVGEGTISQIIDDDELLRAMATGCRSFLVGIEDFTHATRGSATKTRIAKNEGLDHMVKRLRKMGLPTVYSLIFGSDLQQPGYARYAASRVNELGITVSPHLMTPRRGTPFYDRVVREGRLRDCRSGQRNMRYNAVHDATHMTREQIIAEYLTFMNLVYTRAAIASRFTANLRDCGPDYAFSLLITDLAYRGNRNITRLHHPEIARIALDHH